jgi:PadR family transcriptional regulator, regulatory protein PadR
MPPPRYRSRIDLLQGTLDLIILQTLQAGPQHGYGLSQAINTGSREVLKVETGSLYPALHRLEKHGWVVSSWSTSANSQRTKVYRLTPSGRKQLVEQQTRWQSLVTAMRALMAPGKTEA